MIENELHNDCIFSKSKPHAKKLSNLSLLFCSEGEETSIAPATTPIIFAFSR
jgi:hypothetical protein